MRENTTYVAHEKFTEIVARLGLPTEEKKGWLRINSPASPSYRVYVPFTKRVGRIDVAGLPEADEVAGCRRMGGEKFGAVAHQLDMSLPEADILANFEAVLAHISGLAAPEKKAKKFGPKAEKVAKEEVTSSPEEIEAKKARKARLLAKVAKEKGVEVSPNAEAQPEVLVAAASQE
jgi:hypothetical protein